MAKVEYFDRLNAIHYWGRYEQWIKFFLKTVGAAAEMTLRRVEAAIVLRDRYIATINSENKDVKHLLNAYTKVEKHIFLNVASLAVAIGVSYNTGARIMKKLVGMGIMRLLKAQARNRVYFYAELLDVAGITINATYID